jgi:membrane-bound serine protease (ClpP class)
VKAALLALLLPLSAWAGGVHVAELRGSINPGSAAYVLDSLHAAQAARAELFVLRLDTPGGLLASTRSIIQGISASPVPVSVWVSPGGASATSAGALIALSAHVIVMQEGTNLGAAHPVGGAGEDIKGVMGEKVTNDTAALARAQAALHGRNVIAAEEIVTKSTSFSADEAVAKHVADFVAGDLPTIFRTLEGRKLRVGAPPREVTLHFPAAPELARHEMTAQQAFLHFISDPNVSTILLSLGGLAIWAEVSSGFSSIAAGVVGLLCFVLGLVSLQTLPVNTGGAILLVLGFALLVAEAFVTSYGLLSAGALVSLFLGGLFLLDPAETSMHVSLSLLASLLSAMAIVLGSVGYLLLRDRRHGRVAPDPVLHAEARVATVESGGTRGTAYVNGELWAFESGAPLGVGETALVSSVRGLKIHLNRRN